MLWENPTGFHLTAGQRHDLEGADALLHDLDVAAVIADRAYDANDRVIKPLLAKGVELVIPAKKNRIVMREHGVEMYKARHLIENFFSKIKQFRGIATRYDKLARVFESTLHL